MKTLLLLLNFLIISFTLTAQTQTVPIQNAHSALWYNPEQSGHGLNVYLFETNRIIVIWYIYDDTGKPLWLLGIGTHDGTIATLDVKRYQGPMFPPDFNSSDVNSTYWGTFELSFSGCDSGLFKWFPVSNNDYSAGELSITRLTSTLGLDCSNTVNSTKSSSASINSGYSALWYNPEQSGHGINVYMLDKNRIIVIWYVYDNEGNPIWLLGIGTHDGLIAHLDVKIGSGAQFPPNFDTNDVVLTNWGTFDLEFSDCNSGIFSWTPVLGNGYTMGQTPIVRLNTTQGLSCSNYSPVTQVVTQQPFDGNSSYKILAANDLGMHCADIDNQIFSILPPFNVVHAQVIKMGDDPILITPSRDAAISVVYSATANINDPVLDDNNPTMPAYLNPSISTLENTERSSISINSTSQNDLNIGLLKSNFWNTNTITNNPIGYDNYDNIFFGLLDPNSLIYDIGLPVPESTLLPECLSNPADCNFDQQAMPGKNDKFIENRPKLFRRFDNDVNFFSSVLNSPLGSIVQQANWWSADGIPMLPVDDAGRSNPYPLMRIQAKKNGSILASTDVVLPVASEADCHNCHAQMIDCADMSLSALIQTDSCNEVAISPTGKTQTVFEVAALEEAPGLNPDQQLLNASKINILRLHDVKHGNVYPTDWGLCDAANNANDSSQWNENCLSKKTPIQCSQCHYSPALDLAQLGPTDNIEQQVFQESVGLSMSSVMHKFHGQYLDLFPDMPAPNNPIRKQNASANGFPQAQTGQSLEQYVLQETCYQCHPGKRAQCLRGAMASGGVVCQDCHGEMADVGHDFTSGGSRVPWASQPKCQSCHTGDAKTKNHPSGALVADDGIRLLQAYVNDANSPIASPNSRFAENESLYRLSGNKNNQTSTQGHGGVMCEGCHGSTHAIWPNENFNANDNVAAIQLQGHTGTITECRTCHTESLRLSQKGPHGMHDVSPVSNNNGELDRNIRRTYWNREHEDVSRSSCKSCHGNDGLGTVLSKTAADRTLACDKEGLNGCTRITTDSGKRRKMMFVPKGTEIRCNMCHRNRI
jgi:hypothetical protein